MVEQKSTDVRFYVWIATIAIALAVGAWGVITLLVDGHSTTGTSSQVPWGIFVPGYVFFVAASAGCVIVGLGYVLGVKGHGLIMKRAVFLGIVTLIAGGILIILDLGSPGQFLNFVLSPNPRSPMWWMVIFYPLYLLLLLIEFYLISRNASRKLQGLTLGAALSAIAVHSTLGAIFGFAAVRTYFGWALSPIYFILIAIVIGTALLLLTTILHYKLSRTPMSPELTGTVVNLGKLLAVALGITIFFTVWKGLGGVASTVDSTALGYDHIFSLWWYWLFVAALGLVVPFILLNPKNERNINIIAVSSVLALIGMFAARLEFTIGGLVAPVIADLRHLVFPLGTYQATWVEIAVMTFAAAFAALLYTIGTRVFALEKVVQHD